jgi:hypothetical protein
MIGWSEKEKEFNEELWSLGGGIWKAASDELRAASDGLQVA